GIGRTELPCALEVVTGRGHVPAAQVFQSRVHPGTGIARALANRVLPESQRVAPLPRPVVSERDRGEAKEQAPCGESAMAGRGSQLCRAAVKQPREQDREPERGGDVGPVVVDNLGEGRKGGLRSE